MIDHCKSSYSDPNLKWSQMDVESSECQVYADTATIVRYVTNSINKNHYSSITKPGAK